MKHLLLLFTTLFVLFPAISQIDYYSKRYMLSSDLEAKDMVLNPDNGLVVVGQISNEIAFITYIDQSGNEIWSKRFSNSENNYNFNKIIQLQDSTFVAVGSTYNTLIGRNGAACVRIDRFGDTLWTKSIDNSVSDQITAYDVIQLQDSNLLLTGSIGGQVPFAIKLDLNGNKIWGKTYDNPGILYSDLLSVKEQTNGDLLFCGSQYNSGYDGLVIQTNELGTVLSSYVFSDGEIKLSDVIIQDSSYYFVNSSYGAGVIKTDSSLNIDWAFDFASSFGGNYDYDNYKLNILHDSSFIFVASNPFSGGATNFDKEGNVIHSIAINGQVIRSVEDNDSSILLLSNGPLWGIKAAEFYPVHYGINKVDSLLSNTSECYYPIEFVPNGLFCSISMGSLVDLNGMQSYDMGTIINDEDLSVENGCVYRYSGIDELSENQFSIYPNPVKAELSIHRSDNSQANYEIIDQSGRIIVEGLITFEVEAVNLSKLENGFYLIKIGNQSQKFLKL